MPFKDQSSDNSAWTGQVFVVDETKCQQCHLWITSFNGPVRRSAVYGRGTGASGLLVIGEALGAQEILDGMPFVGRAGQLASEAFVKVGIAEHEAYITNTTRCRPPNNRPPTAEEFRLCMAAHGQLDVSPHPVKVILLLGAVALKAILGKQKITERRGQWHEMDWYGQKVKVMPTYHPAAILRKPELYQTFEDDLKLVRDELIGAQVKAPPKIHKELVNSKDRFLKWMAFLRDIDIPIASDIETTGLKFFKDEIASISIVFRGTDGKYYGIAFLVKFNGMTSAQEQWWMADLDDPEIREALTPVLERATGIDYHNSGFDALFKWSRGFNVKIRYDTLDEHLVLDETTPQGLKFLATKHFPQSAGYNEKILEVVGGPANISKAPPEILLDYNIEDSFYTRALDEEVFTPALHEDGMYNFYIGHAMPLKRTLARMKFRGFLVDKDRVMIKSDEYRVKVKLEEELLFDTIKQKINYGSPQQLTKLLYQDIGLPILRYTEKGSPSTNAETLIELSKQHPVPKIILGLRHKKKDLSTYLDGWDGDEDDKPNSVGGILQWLDSNNRVHPDFLSHGTISGRLAAREPSMLNIPRDPDIRMNFMAPEGWKLLDFDYSQAELVLLAYLSQDPGFIEAVSTSDLHQTVMDKLLSKAVQLKERFAAMSPKDLRNVAKAVNFRKAYRGGPAGLAVQLKLAVEETEQWYKEWDEAFPYIPQWWVKMETEWRQKGYIEGVYGRRKHFPPAFDQSTVAYYDRLSANFPCQNGVADTTNRSLFLIDQSFEKIFGWHPKTIYQVPGLVLAVHDNIIGEAPDELVDDVKTLMATIMSLPVPKLDVQLRTDYHCVQRWGQDEYEKQLKADAEKAEKERITIQEHELKDEEMR